jgi:hypothetical protein
MPIYQIQCPDCGHRFQGVVFTGTRMPQEWVCSACGSHGASPREDCEPEPHPLEHPHGQGCPCCGG